VGNALQEVVPFIVVFVSRSAFIKKEHDTNISTESPYSVYVTANVRNFVSV
jgi:hypothetical protein